MSQTNREDVLMRLTKVEAIMAEHCRQNEKDFAEIKQLLKDALENKADKWVENWMYGIIFLITSSVIGLIIYLVEKGI